MEWITTKNHWTKGPDAEEIRLRISISKKEKPIRYWLGKHHTKETIDQISLTKRNSKSTIKGIDHHNWKGGVTIEHNKLRNSSRYTIWRNEIYKKDNWTCYICKIKCKKGNIVAHHIKKFSDYPDLRFDINNGMTLCRKCHIKIESPISLKHI